MYLTLPHKDIYIYIVQSLGYHTTSLIAVQSHGPLVERLGAEMAPKAGTGKTRRQRYFRATDLGVMVCGCR